MVLEDYGVLLAVSRANWSRPRRHAQVRPSIRNRDIERDIEDIDTKLVTAMIEKVQKKSFQTQRRESRNLVMVVQG